LSAYPTFEEWFRGLTAAERRRTSELLATFKALGADDPEGWTRSEISEDIPQLARFLLLRGVWPDLIDSWSRDPQNWTEKLAREAAEKPKEFFADAGLALGRALAAGVSASDLGSIARMVAYETAFGVLNRVDEGYDPDAAEGSPGWVLIETDADGTPTDRRVPGLHESVLTMDPTGREGKPP
jgi:hypothetical protein